MLWGTSSRVPEVGFLGRRVWPLWQLKVRLSTAFLPDPRLKWPHTVKVSFHCYLLFPKGLIHDSASWKDVFFPFPVAGNRNPFTLAHVKRELSRQAKLIFSLDNLSCFINCWDAKNTSAVVGKSCCLTAQQKAPHREISPTALAPPPGLRRPPHGAARNVPVSAQQWSILIAQCPEFWLLGILIAQCPEYWLLGMLIRPRYK